MTITQTLKLATAKLKAKDIDVPRLEAEILLSSILKKPAELLLAHGEVLLSPKQITKFRQLLNRRLKGEPIAYLTGHKEFYGLDFLVNKNVLIPRPETELMVDETLKLASRLSAVALAKVDNPQPVTLIDIGTGSGCIIISLAKQIKNYELKIKNCKLIGTDISTRALTVARANSKIHGVNKQIKFIQGNLLKPLINHSKFEIRNSKFVILSNLPYLPAEALAKEGGWSAWKNNSSLDTIGLKFEPEQALFTGNRGLELYEKLLKQIKELRDTRCELRDFFVLCEFDPRQTKMIKKLIKHELPRAKVQIKKDLAGLNRLAIIKI